MKQTHNSEAQVNFSFQENMDMYLDMKPTLHFANKFETTPSESEASRTASLPYRQLPPRSTHANRDLSGQLLSLSTCMR